MRDKTVEVPPQAKAVEQPVVSSDQAEPSAVSKPKPKRAVVTPVDPKMMRMVWLGCLSFLVLGISIILGSLWLPLKIDPVDIHGRTYIVTGCALGNIEIESAKYLLELGATTVICTVENDDALTALKSFAASAKYKGVLIVDLMDPREFSSVKEFARKINQRPGVVDGVTLSRGIYTPEKVITPDGFDAMYQVNYLSQVLLLRLIEGKFANDVRVVFHSSSAYFLYGAGDSKKYLTKPGGRKLASMSDSMYMTYADTKLFQILAAYEYAYRWPKKFPNTNATFNAACPGLIGPIEPVTLKDGVLSMIRYGIMLLLERTPKEGAMQGVMIQTQPMFANVTGFFVPSYFFMQLSPRVTRPIASALWNSTSELIGVPQ